MPMCYFFRRMVSSRWPIVLASVVALATVVVAANAGSEAPAAPTGKHIAVGDSPPAWQPR